MHHCLKSFLLLLFSFCAMNVLWFVFACKDNPLFFLLFTHTTFYFEAGPDCVIFF
jgi:hypothetical protein